MRSKGLYRERVVAVVGGSDSATKEALLLAEHASKVYIIARGLEIKPEPINRSRVEANKKITVITGTNVVRIDGDKKVRAAILDKPYNGGSALALDAVFVAVGKVTRGNAFFARFPPLGAIAEPRVAVKRGDYQQATVRRLRIHARSSSKRDAGLTGSVGGGGASPCERP